MNVSLDKCFLIDYLRIYSSPLQSYFLQKKKSLFFRLYQSSPSIANTNNPSIKKYRRYKPRDTEIRKDDNLFTDKRIETSSGKEPSSFSPIDWKCRSFWKVPSNYPTS